MADSIPSQLFLLAAWRQWLALRDSDALEGDIVVASCDLDTVVDAGARGVSTVGLYDFLSYSRSKCHVERAWAFCDEFAKTLKGRFVCQGCDLLDRMKFDLVEPLVYALSAAEAIETCLRERLPERVRIFPDRDRAFIRKLAEPPPDLFNAVAWWQAERAGFKPAPVEEPLRPAAARRAADAAPPSQTARHRVATDFGVLPGESSCLVLSFSGMFGMAEHECALAYAAKTGRMDWFVDSAEPLGTLPHLNLAHLWRLPVAAGNLERELAAFKKVHLPAVRSRLGPTYDVLLDNPHAAFFWDHVVALIRHGAMNYAAGRALAEGLRPAVALMGKDHVGETRCLARGLADAGARPVFIQHGGVRSSGEYRRSYRDNPYDLAVWNEEEVGWLRAWRDARAALPVVGSLRLDLDEVRRFRPSPPSKTDRPRIVLLSTCVTDMYGHYGSSTLQLKTWLEIYELCRRHSEWDFQVKSHPRYRYRTLPSEAALVEIPNLKIVEGKALDVLAGASAAVALTELSTVILDAMAANVPVVWLQAAVVWPEVLAMEEQGWVAARSVGKLEEVLLRLLNDDAYRARRVAAGREFLQKTLPYTGDEAAARLFSFIDSLTTAGPAESRPPDSSARWIIDLLSLLASTQMGQVSEERFCHGMASLRRRRHEVDVRRLNYLEVTELGGFILQASVQLPWTRPDIRLPALVRMVHGTLPATIRPSFSVLRNCMVHAYLRQDQLTPGWRTKLMSYFLAPGRLRNLHLGKGLRHRPTVVRKVSAEIGRSP